MVGGLADWFAVTALFRHPLGLPIPHTAIVPRNKDRIGDQLAQFLRDNFLIPRVDRPADAAARRRRRGRALADRSGRGRRRPLPRGRVEAGRAGARGARSGSGSAAWSRAAIAARLRETEVAPLLGQLLKAAMAEERHKPLLDAAIRWAASALADERPSDPPDGPRPRRVDPALDRARRDASPNKLIDGLDKLLADMADDPEHPLRAARRGGARPARLGPAATIPRCARGSRR